MVRDMESGSWSLTLLPALPGVPARMGVVGGTDSPIPVCDLGLSSSPPTVPVGLFMVTYARVVEFAAFINLSLLIGILAGILALI